MPQKGGPLLPLMLTGPGVVLNVSTVKDSGNSCAENSCSPTKPEMTNRVCWGTAPASRPRA